MPAITEQPGNDRHQSDEAEEQFYDATDGLVDLPVPPGPHTVTTGIHFK